MKRGIIVFFIHVLLSVVAFAQAPQLVGYQAVIRDANGKIMKDSPVGVKISIMQNSEYGNVVYEERRVVTTSSAGLISFALGDSQADVFGSLGNIDWTNGPYFLRCDWALDGSDNYALSSTSQIKSVPYALYAEKISDKALPEWARRQTKPQYRYDEIVGAPRVIERLSELDNDLGFVSESEVERIVGRHSFAKDSTFINSVAYRITDADIERWNSKGSVVTMADSAFLNSPAASIQQSDIDRWNHSTGDITIPKLISAFQNDAKYVDESMLDEAKQEFSVAYKNLERTIDNLTTKLEQVSSENAKLKNDFKKLYAIVEELAKGNKVDTADIINLDTADIINPDTTLNNDTIVKPQPDTLTYARAAENSYSFKTYDFNDGSDLYNGLKKDDRIMFIIRHAERSSDTSKEGKLTQNGENQTSMVGEKFRNGQAAPGDCFYGATDYFRCKKTSYLIAQARGDENVKSIDDIVNPISIISQNYFTPITNWPAITRYYENNTAEVDKTANSVINELCKMSSGKKFAWFTSHDFFTLIMTEWASDQAISFSSPRWINYLAGVAVIVHPDGQWEVYPVKNLDSGYNTEHDYSNW